ncbi:MAG: cyclic 2,3-diphosphoglycerate synthase [Planctomycetota bacterium]|jgi:predicted GTPase
MATRVLIMGAAGKDFHVFNTCYRDNEAFEVVAFTATQIPNIEGRTYPGVLAGKLYPDGIPIMPEEDLEKIIKDEKVDEVIFAYSDVSLEYLEERRKCAEAAGAGFDTFDIEKTMIPSSKPVIAICAVRTGCGKSQTTRYIMRILKKLGKKVVAIRHPMPYGDLAAQAVQRFAELADLEKHKCTIEEIEEYEPHIKNGGVVYAGVDYGAILKEAEKEADVILWDGGNNDTPFYKPDLHVVVADPLRPGHEMSYFPGDVNFKMGNLIIINKMDQAKTEDVESILANLKNVNPKAAVVKADSPLTVADPSQIKDKRVLVVEDGPTLTHGGMKIGAGTVAARQHGAKELVDPRPYLVGTLKETFQKYPDIGTLLPAMGYGDEQCADLQATIDKCDCDVVVIGTPIDLGRIIKIGKPSVRVLYELAERDGNQMEDLVKKAIGM